jgi:hypothetical protein
MIFTISFYFILELLFDSRSKSSYLLEKLETYWSLICFNNNFLLSPSVALLNFNLKLFSVMEALGLVTGVYSCVLVPILKWSYASLVKFSIIVSISGLFLYSRFCSNSAIFVPDELAEFYST